MLKNAEEAGKERGRPLTWRIWILVPLALISASGIAIPIYNHDYRRYKTARELEQRQPAPRHPYNGALDDVLERASEQGASVDILKALSSLRDEVRKDSQAHNGTITEDLHRRVQAMLDRFPKR